MRSCLLNVLCASAESRLLRHEEENRDHSSYLHAWDAPGSSNDSDTVQAGKSRAAHLI